MGTNFRPSRDISDLTSKCYDVFNGSFNNWQLFYDFYNSITTVVIVNLVALFTIFFSKTIEYSYNLQAVIC